MPTESLQARTRRIVSEEIARLNSLKESENRAAEAPGDQQDQAELQRQRQLFAQMTQQASRISELYKQIQSLMTNFQGQFQNQLPDDVKSDFGDSVQNLSALVDRWVQLTDNLQQKANQ